MRASSARARRTLVVHARQRRHALVDVPLLRARGTDARLGSDARLSTDRRSTGQRVGERLLRARGRALRCQGRSRRSTHLRRHGRALGRVVVVVTVVVVSSVRLGRNGAGRTSCASQGGIAAAWTH